MKKQNVSTIAQPLFQKMFEHNHDGMIVLEKNGVIVGCNHTAEKMFAKKKTDMIGKQFISLLPKTERHFFVHASHQKETKYIQMKEGVLTVDVQVFEVSGVAMRVLTFYLLSYKKEIERDLLLAKTTHRTLIEMVKDDIFILDRNGKIQYVNEIGAKTVGLKREQIVGKKITYLFPKDARHIKASVQVVLKTKDLFVKESEITFPCGLKRWCRTHLIPIKEQEEVVAILCVVHDISEHKTIEEVLLQLEEKYETLVEKSSDGILVVQNDVIRFVNKQMEKMLFIPASECVGKKFIDFVMPADRIGVTKHIRSALKAKICDVRCEFEIQVQGNSKSFVEAHGSLISYEGKPAIMLMVRDKTQLHEIEKMKSDFISITSHQMRTPLTGIKWFIELMRGEKIGALNKEQKEYLEQVAVSNERMIHLVNDLLNVGQIERGNGFNLKLKTEDPRGMLQGVINDQIMSAQKKQQKIRLEETVEAGVSVRMDKTKMLEVYQNILNNAIKYSPEKTEIIIRSAVVKKEYVVFVSDYGAGIPEKQQEKIFQRFFRADNVINTQGGTGLGLYVAKGVVEKHKGRIWFESKEGKGSTFYVALPIKQMKKI